MAAGHQESSTSDRSTVSQTRRSALKKMLVGTGVAAGAAVLPDKWTKPVVDRILVPAHAQTSTTTTTTTTTTEAQPEYTFDCNIDASCGNSEGPPPNNGFPVTVTVTGTVTATGGASVAGLGITYSNDLENTGILLDHEGGNLTTDGGGAYLITSILYAPDNNNNCGSGNDLDVITAVTLTITGQTCHTQSVVNCSCPPR